MCSSDLFRGIIHSLQKCQFSLAPDPRHPYPTGYIDRSDEMTRSIKFVDQMDSRLVFFGSTDHEEKICIKFARTYSEAVHLKCAYNGHAPALKGFQRLAGGWYMIVMEDLRDSHRNDITKQRLDHVKNLLMELHQDGYAHGDIRSSNILVGDAEDEFVLLDFDWAGEIGTARYPMNLNRSENLWRPEGARDGQLILAEHDIAMLEFLQAKVSQPQTVKGLLGTCIRLYSNNSHISYLCTSFILCRYV